MSCYNYLAPWYDKLTEDIPYERFADFYETQFGNCGGEFRLLLDLCCGTGTLTWTLAERGYELIAADRSVEMLAEAQSKARPADVAPLFLNQSAEALDLYGTVDAAVCSLDGINYIPPESLPEVFHRLHLFIRPDGLFIFDIRTPELLRELDGEIFVDEKDDLLCLWRADFDRELSAIVYGMDIFSRRGKLWERQSEEHIEYAHEPDMLVRMLRDAGFRDIALHRDCPQGELGRLFIVCKREHEY